MGCVVNATSLPIYSRKRPGTHLWEAGWAPRPVWTGAENLAPAGIRSPDLIYLIHTFLLPLALGGVCKECYRIGLGKFSSVMVPCLDKMIYSMPVFVCGRYVTWIP